MPIWRMLLVHVVLRACSRAWAKTGKRIAARMAMIAITTSNSIRVKPFRRTIACLLVSVFTTHVSRRTGESLRNLHGMVRILANTHRADRARIIGDSRARPTQEAPNAHDRKTRHFVLSERPGDLDRE